MKKVKIRSLPPLSSDDAEVLILGTLPGKESLRCGEYYADPRNQFWTIIAEISGKKVLTTYNEKTESLSRLKIALWDVLESAEREGGRDATIEHPVPNKINEFLGTHEKIKIIGFNGKKAERLFYKSVEKQQNIQNIKYVSLPSTSGLNTHMNIQQKRDEWERILQEINLITLLGELGISDNRETREKICSIPDVRNLIYTLPESLLKIRPSIDKLEQIIRGLCLIDGWTEHHFAHLPGYLVFGSTSPVHRLLKRLGPINSGRNGSLVDWLFSHRTNPYIPFGYHIPLGINSYEEYSEYERVRAVHRETQIAKDKEISRLATARRLENARAHAERSAKNRANRQTNKINIGC